MSLSIDRHGKLICADGQQACISGAATAVPGFDREADALRARIVQCVNACAEDGPVMVALRSGIKSLEQLVELNRIPAGNAGLRDLRDALRALGG